MRTDPRGSSQHTRQTAFDLGFGGSRRGCGKKMAGRPFHLMIPGSDRAVDERGAQDSYLRPMPLVGRQDKLLHEAVHMRRHRGDAFRWA